MARRGNDDMDALFEAWARWCFSGGGSMDTAPTVLARWMESKGHVVFGGSGGQPSDTVEERIEAAVVGIASKDAMTAKVLRFEYGIWSGAGEWRDQRDPDQKTLTQADKAARLRLGLRTYKRRLANGREIVATALAACERHAGRATHGR